MKTLTMLTKEIKLALKNNALFRSCVSKIKHILIDNADIIMPMHNLLK